MSEHRSKVLIIGSGPAGYTAAIYAARANLKPIVVQGREPGGQLMVTTDVENYPGFDEIIQGPWLMEQMEKQAKNVGVEIMYDMIDKVDFSKRPFTCESEQGNTYIADTVIVATGAQAQWLGLESETKFRGFGVSGCATCDGFFFRDKPVAIIGGGDTAAEEALYMTNHTSKIYLIHRRDELRASKVLQDRIFKEKKIEILWNKTLDEVVGTENPKAVTGIKLRDTQTNETSELAVEGVFIAIGHTPMTDIFKGQLELDKKGYLKVTPGTTRTNIPGVFAAGDVHDKEYRQAVTAAGFGCMAALDAERFLAENAADEEAA
jgi:thioredoxin reductase (NADPH)